LHAGAAILAVAFLTKAAVWPLNFWLVPAYTAASAPVAAIFALMTKVGVYTLLRLSTLLFGEHAGASAHFGAPVFLYGGLATIVFGVAGLMASMNLGRIAGFSVIVSSGTLLAAIGIGDVTVTSAALYYLLSATPAASALFLLVELVERTDDGSRLPLSDVDLEPGEDTNLDDDETPLVGRVFPVSLALLGLAFIACALLVAGLPPLSGFIAKLSLLTALLSAEGLVRPDTPATANWVLFALLLLAGLASTIALTRAGIRHFWSVGDRSPPLLRVFEGTPVLALILGCLWLTVSAEPVMRYTRSTADALHAPRRYIDAVMSAKPAPPPSRTPHADRSAP
jgi:multicomponent K+:H+ antiporter subunit D